MEVYRTVAAGRPTLSLLHDTAYLYLCLACDRRAREPAAKRAAAAQLRAWYPGVDPKLVDHVVREASLSFTGHVDEERVGRLLFELGDALEAPVREQVLGGLARAVLSE